MKLETVAEFFYEIFYLKADVRVRDKLLMGSPVGVIVIVTCYLLISKYLPVYMKSRKNFFNVGMLHFGFNLYVLLFSSFLVYKSVKYMIWSNYNFRCMGLDLSTRNETMEMIEGQHQMLLFKLTYCFETIPFILGGHFKLVFVYIVYHHASMPLLVWIATNYYPGGHAIFFGFINMSTHMIMYGYFFLMGLIPKLRKVNWHLFISILDIVQMAAIGIHGAQLYFDNSCEFPMILVHIAALWSLSIVIVFAFTWPFFGKNELSEYARATQQELTKKTTESFKQKIYR